MQAFTRFDSAFIGYSQSDSRMQFIIEPSRRKLSSFACLTVAAIQSGFARNSQRPANFRCNDRADYAHVPEA